MSAADLDSSQRVGKWFVAPPLSRVHPKSTETQRRWRGRPVGGGAKRAFDIIIAVCALPLVAPLMALIALLVKLDSTGPALFRQRRGGYRGRAFIIYKFRTMTTEEDGNHVSAARREDPRVTKLGAFLRKSSLDELPQIINVLRGDMSFVGPRPHALAHDAEFTAIEPTYRNRGRARPGITGLAQVSGSRGSMTSPEAVKERVRYDLQYVEVWNFWGDISIMARTVARLFGDERAY